MYFQHAYIKFMLGAFAAFCMTAPAFSAPKVKSLTVSKMKAESTFQSCKTLTHCVDILETHGIESFDYAVLARDFDRFGDKGRQLLWRLVDAGPDGSLEKQTLANRALDMLSRSPKILPPAEQRHMVDIWTSKAGQPYDPSVLARLMTNNLSPMVRSKAINTLSSNNEDVSTLSRSILAETLQRKMNFPMPPGDFVPLSRAAISDPSPTLTALIALYPADTSAPVLARLLGSGDVPSVIEAYNSLYEADAENAFKALVSTLYSLKPNNAKAAIGLGGLLAHRHPLRKDGFYMNFASELSQDSEMSPAGRAAGFDALLRRQGQKGVPALNDTALNKDNYRLALSAFEDGNIPSPYFSVPQIIDSGAPDSWLEPLSRASKTTGDKIMLTEVAGIFDTRFAQQIAASSYDASGDYRINIAGILAKAAQAKTKDQVLTAQLTTIIKNHPVTQVRAAAKIGLEALASKSPRKNVFKLQSDLPRRTASFEPRKAFCKTVSINLKDMARAMPYYDSAQLPGRLPADRAFLTSGARTKNGWLAGYSRPGSGGLILYNNVSGTGRELFDESTFGPQAVIAVLPTTRVPLGQTASTFWIFATSLKTAKSAIYRARQSASGTVQLTQHAVLPAQPSAINIHKNSEITFAMSAVNPPLTLSQNGTLSRACDAKTP